MSIDSIDSVTRDDVIESISNQGVSISKLHGYFIGNDYIKVSIAMFSMELDTAIVRLKHNSRTSELDLIDVSLLDETLI